MEHLETGLMIAFIATKKKNPNKQNVLKATYGETTMQTSGISMQFYPLAMELNSGFLGIMIWLFTWMKESGEYAR